MPRPADRSTFDRPGARRMRRGAVLAALAVPVLLGATPAPADPLPAPVVAMIRAASGDAARLDAVTSVARVTNPQSLAEIDALVTSLAAPQPDAAATVAASAAPAAPASAAPDTPAPASATTVAVAAATPAVEDTVTDGGWLAGWNGSIEAGLNRTTGNSSDIGVLLKARAEHEGERWRHKVNALLDRQKSDGELSRARTLADYQFDFKFARGLSLYGLFGWERDRFAGYDRRFTESFGLGYRPVDTDDMTLSLTAGPAFRQIRYVDGSSEQELAGRGSLSYRWQIHPSMELTEVASVVMDGGNTYTSTTSLTSKLIGAVSARLSYDMIHESDPIDDRARTDTTARFSVVYSY